jgi:hypothetical protein
MPWPVLSPFRMRPGLQRLANDLPSPEGGPPLPDALAPAYATARRARLPQAWVGEPDPRVLQRLAQALQAQGVEVAPAGGQVDALAVSAALQDDYVILHDEPEPERGGSSRFRLRFLSVAFPSNWDPAEKLGLDFAAIHAPVADNALIQQGAEGIMDLAFRRQPMQRHVWLLSPDGALPQHPRERQRRWEDALARADNGLLLDEAFFRVERQTTWPLPDVKRAVFFIRVMMCPLKAVLSVAPERSAALSDALQSMSQAVVAYRGMGLVRDRLVDELQALAAHNGASDTAP